MLSNFIELYPLLIGLADKVYRKRHIAGLPLAKLTVYEFIACAPCGREHVTLPYAQSFYACSLSIVRISLIRTKY